MKKIFFFFRLFEKLSMEEAGWKIPVLTWAKKFIFVLITPAGH